MGKLMKRWRLKRARNHPVVVRWKQHEDHQKPRRSDLNWLDERLQQRARQRNRQLAKHHQKNRCVHLWTAPTRSQRYHRLLKRRNLALIFRRRCRRLPCTLWTLSIQHCRRIFKHSNRLLCNDFTNTSNSLSSRLHTQDSNNSSNTFYLIHNSNQQKIFIIDLLLCCSLSLSFPRFSFYSIHLYILTQQAKKLASLNAVFSLIRYFPPYTPFSMIIFSNKKGTTEKENSLRILKSFTLCLFDRCLVVVCLYRQYLIFWSVRTMFLFGVGRANSHCWWFPLFFWHVFQNI